MPIRKRVWSPANTKRKTWVLDYYDHAGKLRHKAFKNRRDAQCFSKKVRVRIGELSTVVAEDELNFVMHRAWFETAEPLTVRAIIQIIGKMWRTTAALSDGERAFLCNFAAAKDRGAFIEERFFDATLNCGKELKSYSYRRNEGSDEDDGWVGLHRFFSMYVINCTEYGEGQEEYGPFAKKRDALAVFDAVITFCT
jgi:hypothetical protein